MRLARCASRIVIGTPLTYLDARHLSLVLFFITVFVWRRRLAMKRGEINFYHYRRLSHLFT